MPAEHQIDTDAGLIVTRWSGVASDRGLLDALMAYQEEYLSDDRYQTFNELVIFKDIPLTGISLKGLKTVGKVASRVDERRPDTRVAFVVNNRISVNLVKLYTSFRNMGKQDKKDIRAFLDEEEAYQWARHGD